MTLPFETLDKLILLTGTLRTSEQPAALLSFKQKCAHDIRQLQLTPGVQQIDNDRIRKLQLLLSLSLDEAVLSTPWGFLSEWSQEPLSLLLFGVSEPKDLLYQLIGECLLEQDTELLEVSYKLLSLKRAGHPKNQNADFALMQKILPHIETDIDNLSSTKLLNVGLPQRIKVTSEKPSFALEKIVITGLISALSLFMLYQGVNFIRSYEITSLLTEHTDV